MPSGALPFGVRYARVVNFISMPLSLIPGVLLSAILAPNLITSRQPPAWKVIVLILVSVLLVSVPLIMLARLNEGLLRLQKSARTDQLIVSSVCLLYLFPLGTLFHALTMALMLFNTRIKEAFRSP